MADLAGRARDLAAANENLRDEITQRERAEEALRQAQKMEAIGQLTGGVAHDFNNLLQVIMGNLEMMLRRHGRRAPNRSFVRMGESRCVPPSAAATLTQRLLAFARRQPLAPTPIDANQLVAGMSDLLRRTLGEAVELETVLRRRTVADPCRRQPARERAAQPCGQCARCHAATAAR